MGLCTAVKKVSRRGKYLVLIGLLLSVLAWITTFSGETDKTFNVILAPSQTIVSENKLREKLISQTAETSRLNISAEKEECPDESPLLGEYLP